MLPTTFRTVLHSLQKCSLALVLALAAAGASAADSAAPPADSGGHCSFNLKNAWAGPYKACIDPSTPNQCAETGKRDENSGATFAPGACPTPNRVGTCAKPDSAVHYYDGEASSLEVGCGFQGGTWKVGQ